MHAVHHHSYTLRQLKKECKKLGIRNSVEYRAEYKKHPGFPANLERTYREEWISYNDFFDIPEFLDYQSLKRLITPIGLKSQAEYKKFLREYNDPTLPYDPQGAYGKQWEDWYIFLGKEQPFQPRCITKPYQKWREHIEEFMRNARGGQSKVTALCRFVRLYIEKYDIAESPEHFMMLEKPFLKPLNAELEAFSDNMKGNILKSTNQFLDYVLDNHLTIEDEETGEILRITGARNPLKLFLTDASVTNPNRAESNKACLPYHFVKKAGEWLLPAHAKNFRSLKHLQIFDADWIEVDASVIDKFDPDCVFKVIGGKYHIWCPTDWIHLYALLRVPLRGRQIAYNDSGEGDAKIADVDKTGKVIWLENTGPLANTTKHQSFIKDYGNNEIGMFVTTNKTSNNGQGYSIPYMPDDLAYWLVRLRKWQQKYNPIYEPTYWSSLTRTNLNEAQLKAKGKNCFLFRAFSDQEPKNPSSALTTRLAATLYNIQPKDLQLAEFKSIKSNLSHYKSVYTPHSMRVSLITAYIMEKGLPIEVVMKIVGHSSIVMSIYYVKVSNSDIRKKLEAAEKIALQSQAIETQKVIERNQIESVKNTLISNNDDLLRSLTNTTPAGNFIFRDYGICPFAASQCHDGGEEINSSQIRSPVPQGYLGNQNCLRCRHFITGPAFIGGLLSITNEILLEANEQSDICNRIQTDIEKIEDELNILDEAEFIAHTKGEKAPPSNRNSIEQSLRHTESEYESAAKKLDMFLCDLQSSYSLVKKCLSTTSLNNEDSEFPTLIKSDDAEAVIQIEESSQFEQLQEICENATIYTSSNAKRAIYPRSQLLDRMVSLNNIAPSLFMLSEEQQFHVGNQLCNLLKARLGTWKRVSELVTGNIMLIDLGESEKIEPSEIQLTIKSSLEETHKRISN